MQEMAFQDFKFQTFSGREYPRPPVVIHPLWKTSTLSNKSGQIWPWNIMYNIRVIYYLRQEVMFSLSAW